MIKNAKPNHLHSSLSPYLKQHAYNPVDWYPWGDAAFEKAKKEDKPVLVSIGYAACHWCHVMERESFEDEKTATFMNQYFVNIKIDREERPDLDHVYMNACQALTGAGGWPLNMFLTPDLLPFTGGTYFPPKPGYGKSSWMEVLTFVHTIFNQQRDKVEEQANVLSSHVLKMDQAFISNLPQIGNAGKVIDKEDIRAFVKSMLLSSDFIDGGFGQAPKFPSAMNLFFLLRTDFFNPDKETENFVRLTLDKMMQGGIYDQVGGGFSRYATDSKWKIPHFEKMLYDNALLVRLYAEAFRKWKTPEYERLFKQTLLFIETEMSHPDGGFYASFDADSEGKEGKYYTFTKTEIITLFGSDNALVCALYNIEEAGNWEHTNILFRTKNNATLAAEFNCSEVEIQNKVDDINSVILKARKKRISPALDNKRILSWNAMMCSAFAEAFKANNDSHYRDVAIKNIRFLITHFSHPDKKNLMGHSSVDRKINFPGFLEDYTAIIAALIDVYEIAGDEKLLHYALSCAEYVLENFSDMDSMLFFTAKYQTDIPIRNKDFYDHATPSGNSSMVNNLLRLYAHTGKQEFQAIAFKMIFLMKPSLAKYSSSFGNWLIAGLQIAWPGPEIVVSGPSAKKNVDMLWAVYYPHWSIAVDDTGVSELEVLRGKFVADADLIYVCRDHVCYHPAATLEEFKRQIGEF